MSVSHETVQAGLQLDLGAPEIIMDYENQGESGPQVKLKFKEIVLLPNQVQNIMKNEPYETTSLPTELKGKSIFNRLRRKF